MANVHASNNKTKSHDTKGNIPDIIFKEDRKDGEG